MSHEQQHFLLKFQHMNKTKKPLSKAEMRKQVMSAIVQCFQEIREMSLSKNDCS